MIKKVLLLFISVVVCSSPVLAGELSIKITPVKDFKTSNKNTQEGDEIKFRVTEDSKITKKGDTIIGNIIKYEPNGFYGQKAKIIIGNFRKENGKRIYGEIYLLGNDHYTLQEFYNNTSLNPFPLIRGGEIILKSNKNTITILTEE